MNRNQGITDEMLIVGMTRPPMKWGVTYAGLLLNVMLTTETFILTKNLAWLLAFIPIHGILYLVCMYEPRFFELLRLWGMTRGMALLTGNVRFWKSNSYSPLALDLPDANGRRKAIPQRIVL